MVLGQEIFVVINDLPLLSPESPTDRVTLTGYFFNLKLGCVFCCS